MGLFLLCVILFYIVRVVKTREDILYTQGSLDLSTHGKIVSEYLQINLY